MELLTIQSEPENKLITDFMDKLAICSNWAVPRIWLGAKYDLNAQKFHWLSLEPTKDFSINKENETCVFMSDKSSLYAWDDANCTTVKHNFICSVGNVHTQHTISTSSVQHTQEIIPIDYPIQDTQSTQQVVSIDYHQTDTQQQIIPVDYVDSQVIQHTVEVVNGRNIVQTTQETSGGDQHVQEPLPIEIPVTETQVHTVQHVQQQIPLNITVTSVHHESNVSQFDIGHTQHEKNITTPIKPHVVHKSQNEAKNEGHHQHHDVKSYTKTHPVVPLVVPVQAYIQHNPPQTFGVSYNDLYQQNQQQHTVSLDVYSPGGQRIPHIGGASMHSNNGHYQHQVPYPIVAHFSGHNQDQLRTYLAHDQIKSQSSSHLPAQQTEQQKYQIHNQNQQDVVLSEHPQQVQQEYLYHHIPKQENKHTHYQTPVDAATYAQYEISSHMAHSSVPQVETYKPAVAVYQVPQTTTIHQRPASAFIDQSQKAEYLKTKLSEKAVARQNAEEKRMAASMMKGITANHHSHSAQQEISAHSHAMSQSFEEIHKMKSNHAADGKLHSHKSPSSPFPDEFTLIMKDPIADSLIDELIPRELNNLSFMMAKLFNVTIGYNIVNQDSTNPIFNITTTYNIFNNLAGEPIN